MGEESQQKQTSGVTYHVDVTLGYSTARESRDFATEEEAKRFASEYSNSIYTVKITKNEK